MPAGTGAGAAVGFAGLVLVSALIYRQSRKTPIDHRNVNDEWEGNLTAGTDAHTGAVTAGPKTPAV